MKYWMAIISREHARIAADGAFLQVCHGKAAPLRKTAGGDGVFIYCPREKMKNGKILRTVEYYAIFKDDIIYQVEQFPGFIPHRKDVSFRFSYKPVVLKDVAGLEFNFGQWGLLARRGFFEISQFDASLLLKAMETA